MRDELLNQHLFDNLRYERNLVAPWRDDFNHHQPYSRLTAQGRFDLPAGEKKRSPEKGPAYTRGPQGSRSRRAHGRGDVKASPTNRQDEK